MEKAKNRSEEETSRGLKDGCYLLVNEAGKAFQVAEVLAAIWTLCDGARAVEEMA